MTRLVGSPGSFARSYAARLSGLLGTCAHAASPINETAATPRISLTTTFREPLDEISAVQTTNFIGALLEAGQDIATERNRSVQNNLSAQIIERNGIVLLFDLATGL